MNPMTITTTHASRFATVRRRLSGIALGLTLGVAVLTPGQAAVAASPGVFNYAQCIPGSRTIIQDMEAYRSRANEHVVLRGALVKIGRPAPRTTPSGSLERAPPRTPPSSGAPCRVATTTSSTAGPPGTQPAASTCTPPGIRSPEAD